MNEKIILILLTTITLTSCDILITCLLDIGPKFNTKTVRPATLNEVYDTTIKASIKNSVFDSAYNYRISFNGNLPEGLSFSMSENNQKFHITGTPTEIGTFQFTLSVKVTSPLESSDTYEDLCFDTDKNNYALNVNIN